MKKNVMLLSCAALLALALAGCSQSTAQADYIGTDAAKAIALEAAGIGEADATFTTAELETRNNTPYYEVDFTAGGQEYDYDIDALTGTVIAGNQQAAGSTGSHGGSTGDTAITADKAKEIALNHAGLTADQVTFVRSNLDQDDGRTCYDVEFYTADYTEYDYEIDANTGDVILRLRRRGVPGAEPERQHHRHHRRPGQGDRPGRGPRRHRQRHLRV